MHLKKMTIFGFKSFADKTTLHFDSGITCIVGPNGCGKSNISDAFRWVFGEQSAKSMRGGKMHDVIFAGSNHRKPLNFAEVSLTLTDIQGSLPIDYEEITITRRLHRSGESEYLLNGNTVRLKDLQALFLDSGVGRNAFSIFEQGKLDQVISYTPSERRPIFEEAAGILRFLQRKKESLKRLEQADLNLSRVQDIHREVEAQIVLLEQQAQKARLFKENQVSLEGLEKASYVLRWQTIEKKYSDAKAKEKKFEERLEEVHEEEAKWKGESHQVKQLLQEQDRRSRLHHEKMFALRSQQELEIRENQSILQRFEEAGQRSRKLKREAEELALGRQSRQKMLAELENKRKRIEADWGNAESEWKQQQDKVKLREQEVADLRQELTLKQHSHLKCIHTNSQWQSDLKQAEVRLENQIERQKSLQHRLHLMKEDEQQMSLKVQERRQNLQQLSGLIDSHKDRLDQYEEDIKALAQESEVHRKELEGVRRQVMESKARQKVLVRMRDDHEGFSSGSKRLIKESEDPQSVFYQILRPLYEYFTPETEVAEAVAVVLRVYAQTLVVNTMDDFARVSAFAENESLQDYSIVCMEWLARFSGQVKSPQHSLSKNAPSHSLEHYFLNSIAIAPTQEEVLKLWTNGECNGGWSSQGIFIDQHGVSFKIKPNENQVFLRESELKKLEEELAHKEDQLEHLERTINRLQQRHSDLLLERSEADKMLRRDEMKLVEFNFSLQKAVTDVEKSKADQRQGEGELQTLAQLVEENKSNFKTLERQFHLSQQELITLQNEKEVLHEEVNKRESALKILQQEQKEKGSLYQQLADDRQQLLHQCHVLEVKEQDHDRQVLRIEEELEELEERVVLLKQNEKQGNQRLATVEMELKEVGEAYSESEIQREEIGSRLHQIEKQWLVYQDEAKRIEHEVNQVHVQVAQFQTGAQGVVEELSARYQLTMQEALELPFPVNYSVEQIEKQIKLLRQTLQDAGDVNLTAIEELENHQVRFTFIKQQMEDMQDSKTELMGIIRQLDGESRTLFRDTFESIRTNFKKNFQILFSGGEADLQLTDSEDILEAGIEISAKPPGKQMRSITLLSGGEKCLTAVALLFAIFEVKPAPFCILDEIDAPLDDTNVDRFVNVVKHFVDRCQFLIITHNKRTMAIGDILFGVSMEEKGVSKLLSLEFSHKETPEASLV